MALYRTFIQLSGDQREFLRGLQKAWVVAGVSKKPPPLANVIRAIIADYEEMLRTKGDPDFVRALSQVDPNSPMRTPT